MMNQKWMISLMRPLTKQYVGGALAGIGVGITIGRAFSSGWQAGMPPLQLIAAMLLVYIGTRIARHETKSKRENIDSEQSPADDRLKPAPEE